jgi:hypothetical protein
VSSAILQTQEEHRRTSVVQCVGSARLPCTAGSMCGGCLPTCMAGIKSGLGICFSALHDRGDRPSAAPSIRVSHPVSEGLLAREQNEAAAQLVCFLVNVPTWSWP